MLHDNYIHKHNLELDISGIAAGDIDAFENVYRKYYPSIFRFLYLSVYDKAVAEDLSQDVFLNLWKCRKGLDPSRSLQCYLYRAAHNHTVNFFRYNARYCELPENELIHKAWLPDEVLDSKFLHREVEKAVQSLPDSCRSVFILNRFEALSYKEIADTLDISVHTVRNHISKALYTLREILQKIL